MSPSNSPKIRVLFLAADPVGTPQLRLDKEFREITAKIRAAEYRDSLELISRWAVRLDDLQLALLEHKPHIVHFSGHGSRAEEIVLEGDDGRPQPLSTAALVNHFRTLKDNVRIVLFNACYSRAQAEAITQIIDCAIGVTQAVGDQAAITFAASFYRALGFGRSVQVAFELGRSLLVGIPEENTPELLMRPGVDPARIVLVGAPPPGVATPITVTTPDGTSFQSETLEKAVVVVDLSRYSDIAKELEEHSGARAVHELNAQVQGLIKGALEGVVDLAFQSLPYKNTGDGAIIALDTAEQAARFAEALHLAAQAHNLKKEVPLAQRHFRVGIWTDPIILDRRTNTEGQFIGFEMAGIAVAKAVRLEGACRTGEVLISPDTWAALPEEMRRLYGHQEEVRGKRGERFGAHRRKVVNPAPWETVPPIPCPYPGMAPFREDDSGRFFGRDQEVQDLVEGLRLHRFLTVIGPSGSGKSSLVFAGLVPALRRAGLFGPGQWLVRTLRTGKTPLVALGAALGGDPADPARAVSGALATQAAARLLLIVDQFEELFTAAGTDAVTFQTALLGLANTPDCYVVITVRADFYPELLVSPLWREIQAHRLEVVPLNKDGLYQAIVRPAEKVDVSVEKALVERLVAESAGEPGILPFLQETLVLLWERREGQSLPLKAYEALGRDGRPGLQVAMARRADKALGELRHEQQAIACSIFLRLVQFGEGRADTRRQQTIAELRVGEHDPLFDETLRHLTDSRLLTLSGEKGGGSERMVDIAHESLISGWTTLQKWVTERRAAEQTRRRLVDKAAGWVRRGRGRGGLLDESELPEAARWLASPDAADLGIDQDLLALVQESRKAIDQAKQDQEEARRRELENVRALAEAKQRELEQAQALAAEQQRLAEEQRRLANLERQKADIERTRADEQVQYSRRLWRSLLGLFGTVALAILLLIYALYQQGQAETQRAQAETRRQEAQYNLAVALKILSQLVMQVGAVDLADVPQMEPVQEKLLLDAQQFCTDFLAKRANDPTVRQALGRVNGYVGDILQMLGKDDEAEPPYKDGIDLLKELVADGHAVNNDYRDLARSYNNLGLLRKRYNRLREAELLLDKAIGLRQGLVDKAPGNREYRLDLQASRYNLATVLARTKRKKEAESIYRNVLTEQERLANESSDSPEWPKYKQEVARTQNNLGILLAAAGNREEAERRIRDAVAIMVELTTRFPSRPGFQFLLARSNNNLANALVEDNADPVICASTVIGMVSPLHSGLLLTARRPVRAELAFRDAQGRLTKLTEDFPKVPDYQQELADIYYNRGETSEALIYFEKALEQQAKLAKDFPGRPAYQDDLAQTHISLGVLLQKTGQSKRAIDHSDQAYRILKKLVVAFRHIADYQEDLLMALGNLTNLLLHQGNLEEARRQGDLEKARSWLDEIKADPDLDPVRENPEFKEILDGLEKALKNSEQKSTRSVGWIDSPRTTPVFSCFYVGQA